MNCFCIPLGEGDDCREENNFTRPASELVDQATDDGPDGHADADKNASDPRHRRPAIFSRLQTCPSFTRIMGQLLKYF